MDARPRVTEIYVEYSSARKLTEAFQDLDFWIDRESIPPAADW